MSLFLLITFSLQSIVRIYIYIYIIYMLVPKFALSQFANWDPSLRTRIYLSQFGNWDHRHNLSLQTGINREIMNILHG